MAINKKFLRRGDYAAEQIIALQELIETLDEYVNDAVSGNGVLNANALKGQLANMILAATDFADFQQIVTDWVTPPEENTGEYDLDLEPLEGAVEPDPITNLTASGLTYASVNLTWTDPVITDDDADIEFILVMRVEGDTPPLRSDTSAVKSFVEDGVELFSDYGMDSETTYSYSIFTRNVDYAWSQAATITIETLVDESGGVT